jgi:signal transduction histidine kinase
MGLGLYVSRQIAELHGGAIRAEFPPDGGSRFVLELPIGRLASLRSALDQESTAR